MHGTSLDHQQVFAQYEPRFNRPELMKEDVAKEVNPRAYLAKIFEGAIERWTGGEYHHEYEESWPHFKQRVEDALQHLCDDLAQKTTTICCGIYFWWCDFCGCR